MRASLDVFYTNAFSGSLALEAVVFGADPKLVTIDSTAFGGCLG
jgi:hypothetical protein